MKNIDKIRQMNSEELAEIFVYIPLIYRCQICVRGDFETCPKFLKDYCEIREWLKQEVEE